MKTFHLQLTIMLLFALLFTISCADDEVENAKNTALICNMEDIAEDLTKNCSEIIFDTTRYCDLIRIEETFELTVEERKWMPYYCMDINDKIYFVDSLGNETYFVLRKKGRNLVTDYLYGYDRCIVSESSKRIYCVNYENVLTTVYSELLNQELSVTLFVEFPRPSGLPIETGVNLKIRGNNTNHLFACVEERNLGYVPPGNLKFYNELELFGEKFYEVHSMTNTWQSSFIPMYYNKEYGIVGFRDQNKKLWKVKR
jgi:hypothetical protein